VFETIELVIVRELKSLDTLFSHRVHRFTVYGKSLHDICCYRDREWVFGSTHRYIYIYSITILYAYTYTIYIYGSTIILLDPMQEHSVASEMGDM
jgi:hypothetical protein